MARRQRRLAPSVDGWLKGGFAQLTVAKKVYISVDFEGMAGVVSGRQMEPGTADYADARLRLTYDTNAAVEAALEAGAEEVVVCDGHAFGENLLPDELSPDALLISGGACTSLQLQDIGTGYDALVVLGHSGAGLTPGGVLDHSFNGAKIYNIRLNGQTMNSEAVLNAAEAGYYNTPLVTMIGDTAAVHEVQRVIPQVEGVIVKTGFTRYCAKSMHPVKARERIRVGVLAGLKRWNDIPPLKLSSPITMELDYTRSSYADTAELVPGVRRVNARTVSFTGDHETVFRLLTLLIVRLGE